MVSIAYYISEPRDRCPKFLLDSRGSRLIFPEPEFDDSPLLFESDQLTCLRRDILVFIVNNFHV